LIHVHFIIKIINELKKVLPALLRKKTLDLKEWFNKQTAALKSNNTSIDEYSLESPTECYKLQILGLICIILFISSLTFNSLLLISGLS
jgi:hypothetical protein